MSGAKRPKPLRKTIMVSSRLRSSWLFVLLGLIHSMFGMWPPAAAGPGGDGFNVRENNAPALGPPAQSGWTSAVQAEFASLKDLIAQSKHQPERRRYWETAARQSLRRESLILVSDRDPVDIVFRRTEALLRHIEAVPRPPDLSAQKTELSKLKTMNATVAVDDTEARCELFEATLKLRRTIAFSNPLLDFDRILFIKRQFLPETSTWGPDMLGNHACDQYFGFHAIPGGGLYVLEGAFSEQPRIRNVLADSVVLNGRFKGKKLRPGGFLSPELLFDGTTILFAYTEAALTSTSQRRRHTTVKPTDRSS